MEVVSLVVTSDKSEGGGRMEVKDGGQQNSTGGGVKRPGQFSSDKTPDPKRKRT